MDEQINDWLAQEYLLLQKTVDDYDARALTFKAWSVTFSAAGIGLAYQQHQPILLLIAALSAVLFWVVEAEWKFQKRSFFGRISEIEKHFALIGHGSFAPFQVMSGWRKSLGLKPADEVAKTPGRWEAALFLGIMLPHAVIAAAGLVLFFAYPPV